jgi:NAD-reducing hydrogenase large subunit
MGQKITIEPVTRVEGHGKVTIETNGNGEVVGAKLHINEFRGFEKFAEGRMFSEMPLITQRACGICPVSHNICAAKAGDAILGVKPPPTGVKLRELLHMGQIVQSHSMHFFHLAGPDLLLGFDSDPAKRNVFGIVGADPQLAMKAVGLRKFGQEVIKKVAGRRIHPTASIPGGMNDSLTAADREDILRQIDGVIADVRLGVDIIRDFAVQHEDLFEMFGAYESGCMGLVNAKGGLEMYDGFIRLKDSQGNIVLDKHDPADYLSIIAEKVENWSYMKFPYYKPWGYPKGAYKVGPLARLGVADHIETPLANAEFGRFKEITKGGQPKGSLYYHYARMIEDLYAAERIKELCSDPSICNTDIVATGHNNWAINQAITSVAKAFVKPNALTEGQLNRVEAAIRCYDPCLSCATHAMGQMPLIVEVLDPDGNVIERVTR